MHKKVYPKTLTHKDLIKKLPINDIKAIEDVRIFSSMSDDELQKLPQFNDDGTVKLFPVGESFLGKLSLIQFVKSIKTK